MHIGFGLTRIICKLHEKNILVLKQTQVDFTNTITPTVRTIFSTALSRKENVSPWQTARNEIHFQH